MRTVAQLQWIECVKSTPSITIFNVKQSRSYDSLKYQYAINVAFVARNINVVKYEVMESMVPILKGQITILFYAFSEFAVFMAECWNDFQFGENIDRPKNPNGTYLCHFQSRFFWRNLQLDFCLSIPDAQWIFFNLAIWQNKNRR